MLNGDIDKMVISIYYKIWNSHLNQIFYSLISYSKVIGVNLNFVRNNELKNSQVIIEFNNKTYFLCYSDDSEIDEVGYNYDKYYKRSLLLKDESKPILPLNFQINFSTNTFCLLKNIFKSLNFKSDKVELIRAIDIFSNLTNQSHSSMKFSNYNRIINDNNGQVIFMTRLWDPARAIDVDEKERRLKQNEFRIKACEIIKDKYPNSYVGLMEDELSLKLAPSIVLGKSQTTKKNYLKLLNNSDICIADDGLKDTPGWKIGEYVANCKAIITTPINIVVEKFENESNYFSLEHRLDYKSIPDRIDLLMSNKSYLKMAESNYLWRNKFLEPINYIKRLFLD